MADDLRPDLDQLLPDRRQRPVLHLLWQRQRRHEIGEIVGRGVKLKPNLVVAVPSNLTNREREVFGLVSGGHTSKAIAHQLDITKVARKRFNQVLPKYSDLSLRAVWGSTNPNPNAKSGARIKNTRS